MKIIIIIILLVLLIFINNKREDFTESSLTTDINKTLNNLYKTDFNNFVNLSNRIDELKDGNIEQINEIENTGALKINGPNGYSKPTIKINKSFICKGKDNANSNMDIFPKYTIMIWSKKKNIPKGWAICDGRVYTLDKNNNAIPLDENNNPIPVDSNDVINLQVNKSVNGVNSNVTTSAVNKNSKVTTSAVTTSTVTTSTVTTSTVTTSAFVDDSDTTKLKTPDFRGVFLKNLDADTLNKIIDASNNNIPITRIYDYNKKTGTEDVKIGSSNLPMHYHYLATKRQGGIPKNYKKGFDYENSILNSPIYVNPELDSYYHDTKQEAINRALCITGMASSWWTFGISAAASIPACMAWNVILRYPASKMNQDHINLLKRDRTADPLYYGSSSNAGVVAPPINKTNVETNNYPEDYKDINIFPSYYALHYIIKLTGA
jgi:hypothetical protein